MSNILKKEDKSRVSVFGNSDVEINKREKYIWANPCTPGRFQWVAKDVLNIEGEYQRTEKSKPKVLHIAKNWDWKLCGTLLLAERNDGSLWVYDGGHRARAAFYRDDIKKLPCMIFKAESMQIEARAFIGANTIKSAVDAFHKYKAGIKAGEKESLMVKALLEKHGCRAAQSPGKLREINCIAALRKLLIEDSELADKTLCACIDIGEEDDRITRSVLCGIFRCAKKLEGRKDIFKPKIFAKLETAGLQGIQADIQREKYIVGKGGEAIEARAVLNIINKGKHRKITFE